MKKLYYLSQILLVTALLIATTGWAGQLRGDLSADRKTVGVGETVTLLLKISGDGPANSYRIEQPNLPELKRFSLLNVSQRNATVLEGEGEKFSVGFLYKLRAEKVGAEKIQSIRVNYRGEGQKEDNFLSVEGVEIKVTATGFGIGAISLLVLLLAVAVTVLIALCLRRRRAPPRKVPSVPREVKRVGSDAAVKALARMEEASRLKIDGDMGRYCTGILEAISGYLKEGGAAEIERIAERLNELCERVKYASDEEAEREIEGMRRKAELFFKKEIREQFAL